MAGFIQVRTQPVATAGAPFTCRIFIVGALPGDVVKIRLAQASGVSPRYSRDVDIPIAGDGGGFFAFDDVVLFGPETDVHLIADDIGSAVPLARGIARVSVVPHA
jgi:hypothetical protein